MKLEITGKGIAITLGCIIVLFVLLGILTEAIDDESDTPEETDDPDVRGVPPDVLTAMIGRLPTGYRLVLNMFVFEQLSHKEIAQRLGIKADTSASQFLRAKKRLAQMIKEYLNRQRT